jgi:hypothetical protein
LNLSGSWGNGNDLLRLLRLNESVRVVDLRLSNRLDVLNDLHRLLLDEEGSGVGVEGSLLIGSLLLHDLLGLGSLDHGIDRVLMGCLNGLLVSLGLSGLLHDLVNDLLTFLAGGNAGIRVVHEFLELLLLLNMVVVGLGEDVEGAADGEHGDEADEVTGVLQVLVPLLVVLVVTVLVAEEGEQGKSAALLALLAHLLVLVGLLGENGHGDVVGTAHRPGAGGRDLAAHQVLAKMNDGLVAKLRLLVHDRGLALFELLGGMDNGLVSELGSGFLNVAKFDSIHEHVVGATLVVRGVLIVVGSGVVLRLELGVSGGGLNSLDGVGGVGSTHHLEERCTSNKGAEHANLF